MKMVARIHNPPGEGRWASWPRTPAAPSGCSKHGSTFATPIRCDRRSWAIPRHTGPTGDSTSNCWTGARRMSARCWLRRGTGSLRMRCRVMTTWCSAASLLTRGCMWQCTRWWRTSCWPTAVAVAGVWLSAWALPSRW